MKSRGGWVIAALASTISAGPAMAQTTPGDPEAGEDVFRKCRPCHDIGPDARNKVGPLLTGIIGRKPGTIEGFAYSPANTSAGAAGLVWSEDELLKYLADPKAYMPGNNMAFIGLKDEQDRRDVIAYLKKFAK